MMGFTLCLAAITTLVLLTPISATCDVCGVRNQHTKDYSTPFQEPASELRACAQYKDASCCDLQAVNGIADGYTSYDSSTKTYNEAACDADPAITKKMSPECKQFFQNEFCFYECDVNISKYRLHKTCEEPGNGWAIQNLPIKATECNAFYAACQDDYFCVDSATQDYSYFAHPSLNAAGQCTLASGNCKTFAELYGADTNKTGGENVCNVLWGGSFLYDPTNMGFTMAAFEGENPNDSVHPTIAIPEPCLSHDVDDAGRDAVCGDKAGFPDVPVTKCEVCHLRNDHTLDVSLPVDGLATTKCAKYKDNSCCSVDTANVIGAEKLYGDDYKLDRCYDFDPLLVKTANYAKCARWFEAEECLYECDVNAGKFRKYETCESASGSNGWQLDGMPLKATECDAMYADCADVHICTCSGAECPPDSDDKSSFAVLGEACKDPKFCSQTVSQRWLDAKEFCEKLWSNSFIYETHLPAAYSMAWNEEDLVADATVSAYVHTTNPNNRVNPEVPFPPACAGTDATAEMCNDLDIAPIPTAGVSRMSCSTAVFVLTAASWLL